MFDPPPLFHLQPPPTPFMLIHSKQPSYLAKTTTITIVTTANRTVTITITVTQLQTTAVLNLTSTGRWHTTNTRLQHQQT